MWWRPNSQSIPSRHVDNINSSQLLITDLQPAEDDTCRRVGSAMLNNPSAPRRASHHPSLPTCHLTPLPVISSPIHPSPSSFIFSSQFLTATLSCCHFNPSFLTFCTLSCDSATKEEFSSRYGLVYLHMIPSSTSDRV